jgi:hypothetical protein
MSLNNLRNGIIRTPNLKSVPATFAASGYATSHRRADMNSLTQKRCVACGEWKDTSEFYLYKKTGTFRPACKACTVAKSRAWNVANPARRIETNRSYKLAHAEQILLGRSKYKRKTTTEETRDGRLKRNYGISSRDYDNLSNSQNGACAICGGDNGGKFFHVDHDHVTGAVRGLLCNNCNAGIGFLKDDVGLLGRAVEYLKRWAK